MKTLREQVGETVDTACGDLDLLRKNLDQVRVLTGDATESISREFQAISDLIGRYRMSLPDFGERSSDPVAAARMDAIAAEINGRVSALVVLLQFGDIVDQLLKFTDRQAAEVEKYLGGLAVDRKHHAEDGASPRDLRLSDANKPTVQTSMRAGDVELF